MRNNGYSLPDYDRWLERQVEEYYGWPDDDFECPDCGEILEQDGDGVKCPCEDCDFSQYPPEPPEPWEAD